jgi:hypothetical protein
VDSEEDDRIEMMIETKLCSIFSSVNFVQTWDGFLPLYWRIACCSSLDLFEYSLRQLSCSLLNDLSLSIFVARDSKSRLSQCKTVEMILQNNQFHTQDVCM